MRRFASCITVLVTALLLQPAASLAAPAEQPAVDAAHWIARDLAAGGGVLPSSSDSWGLTIDAFLALAASGTSGDVARRVADRLEASGPSAYVAPSPASDQGRRAKLAFALLVARRDATQLTADLRASITPAGRLGTATSVFGQAWGVLALARTPEGVPAPAIAYLRSLQCTTPGHAQAGGFGSGSCNTVDADATGIAVLALRGAGVAVDDAALVAALGWIQRSQLPDGSFAMQYAPGRGNANSTGLVAAAARALAAPEAIAAADAAAAYVRDLQVTCASPLVAGTDPSVGGGFPRSWVGAIAYDAAAQDDAIASGIGSAQLTTWRYSTIQSLLALRGTTALGDLTIDALDATTAPVPGCAAPALDPAVGPSTDLPAVTLRVVSAARPVLRGASIPVRVAGLAPGERYVATLSGRVVARGSAPSRGDVVRSVRIPAAFGTAPRRSLRIVGAHARRAGATSVATVAPRALVVRPASNAVRRGGAVRIVVRGLLAREAVQVRWNGAVVARSFVPASGIAVVRVVAPPRVGAARIIACGVTCARRGSASITVSAT